MFDLRLGLALRKSLGEIHALPYPEWREWRTFYMLEPWGWWNEEINTARILTLLHNTHAKKSKPVREFMRDMAKELLKQLQAPPEMDDLTPDERKRRIVEAVKKDLGIK